MGFWDFWVELTTVVVGEEKIRSWVGGRRWRRRKQQYEEEEEEQQEEEEAWKDCSKRLALLVPSTYLTVGWSKDSSPHKSLPIFCLPPTHILCFSSTFGCKPAPASGIPIAFRAGLQIGVMLSLADCGYWFYGLLLSLLCAFVVWYVPTSDGCWSKIHLKLAFAIQLQSALKSFQNSHRNWNKFHRPWQDGVFYPRIWLLRLIPKVHPSFGFWSFRTLVEEVCQG